MNRAFAAVALAISLAAFSASAAPKHPNLRAAHNQIKQAIAKISAAQGANEFDLEGHAAKAKELLEQAEREIGQAAMAANEKR